VGLGHARAAEDYGILSQQTHAAREIMHMRYGRIAGIDRPISRIVQGTIMLSPAELERGFALLDTAFEQGCTAFDTAHGYGMGDCERVLGAWLRERGLRDRVVVIGKGAHPYDGRSRVTPDDITSDLHESLARLELDAIDLYLLHRDDPQVPVGPLVETLNAHKQAGKIRAFGGSNWSHARLQEANEYAAAQHLAPFVASSPNLSLAEQVRPPWEGCLSISGATGQAARDWYAAAGMPIFAWSSLAGGFFSGRFRRDNLHTFEEYADTICAEAYGTEGNFERLDRARALAERKGATVPQIALAYVLAQPLDVYALVGCRSGDEFRENAGAVAIDLTPQELAWLDKHQPPR
jgi:aryl-alcohol dehydrogenase-like predicted oxidoreductase